jgi:predicted RNase H-like HicB family nuclease
MEKYRLSAVVHKEGDWYVSKSPDTNVASQGKTVEEALKNLEEAVALYVEEFGYNPHCEPAILTTIDVMKNDKAPHPVSA